MKAKETTNAPRKLPSLDAHTLAGAAAGGPAAGRAEACRGVSAGHCRL